jgi:uncharacterized protein YndB with AHSA1/START domain
MKTLLLIAFAGIAFARSPVKVTKQATPEKALVFEVTVPASPAAVWAAFSTSAGLSSWLAPGAVVDLRKGGDWMVHFPRGSTAGGTIVDFVPLKEITIAALAPDQFPTVRAERTRARFQFQRAGETTVVRLTQTGWKAGPEWDRAYDYLADGNAQLLEALLDRFATEPRK